MRRRSHWALTLAEREEISLCVATDASIRQIAFTVGRAPSTVRREIRRHGGARTYRAAEADTQAWAHSRRPKPCRLATSPMHQQIVASKLAMAWSPEQVAGWLKLEFPETLDGPLSAWPSAEYGSAARSRATMKTDAQAIYQAVDRAEAVAHAQAFARRWRAGYPQLVTRLPRHLPELLAFFQCPRALWRKLRTTNVIEWCFVEVRRRTRPMVCFVNVQSVDRTIFSIFNRFNLEWHQRTLRQFTQVA